MNSSLASRAPVRIVLAATLALGGLLPTAFSATPVHAGISNPIPLNAQLDPTDTFTADEALFVYFTADITGGDICVVNADVVPASGVDCQSGVAWGTPNHFVGVGSMFEGLEAPFLAIGTWRLLAAPTPTKAVPHPVPEVSIPFHVLPCGATCNPTIGQAAIDAWKSAASQATLGGNVTCTLLDLQHSAKGAVKQTVALRAALYDAIRNPTKVIRGAVEQIATEYVIDFAGGIISVPVPEYKSSEEMAIELLKQLVCSEALMYADIQADPPDPNFTTVAQPSYATIPDPLSPAGFELAVSADRQRALGEAMRHAYERYSGAVAAGQPKFVHLQARAMWEFGSQLVREMRTSAKGLRAYGQLLVADPNLPQPVVTDQAELDTILAVDHRVQAIGLLPQELAQLISLGFTTDEISQIRAEFSRDVSQAPTGVNIDSPLNTLVADLDQSAVAFDAIAREALSVSAQTNSAPVPSFTAVPDHGAAPLDVTFTDSSDPVDGDPLSFSWDFGDGTTGSGRTVIHRFSAAGAFTVTETVADSFASATAQHVITVGLADTTAPSCVLTGVIAGPPKQIQITAQDVGSGLQTIVVTNSVNATVNVPAFTPGTNAPVVVTATKTDQTKGAQVGLQTTDVAGNVTICDPEFLTIKPGEVQRIRDVPRSENRLTLSNGSPGLRTLRVTVNRKVFELAHLRSNEVRVLDISSAMVAGSRNTVTIRGYGRRGSSADIVLSD